MTLCEIIDKIKSAERLGADTDDPEGSMYIMLSDTLCREIIGSLEIKARIEAMGRCDCVGGDGALDYAKMAYNQLFNDEGGG